MHEAYALILGKFTEGLNNKLQARTYWEIDMKNQPIGILEAIKEINKIIKTVNTKLNKFVKQLKIVQHQTI